MPSDLLNHLTDNHRHITFMADLPDQVPFEGLHPRKSAGRRRLSYASQNSGSLRSHNPGQRVSSALSIRSHFSYAGYALHPKYISF